MYFDNAVTKTSGDPIIRMVVCSASRDKNEILTVSPRHYDPTMHKQIQYRIDHGDEWEKSEVEQGFIDQFGVFMDRREAWKVALAADQIRYRCGGDTTNGGMLYSENLY